MVTETPQWAFEREFRIQLERHRSRLIEALQELVATRPPSRVKVLTFEIASNWRRFPVHAFAMADRSPDEVYFEKPFSGPLLADVGPLLPRDSIDQESYEDAGVDTFEAGAKVLAQWFGECWDSAGGLRFTLPAYIYHHDRAVYYDLRSKQWVSRAAIWK